MCLDQNNCKVENCIKRHPQLCRNFNKSGKCRHKDKCAYQHVKHEDLNQQNEINKAVTQVIIKHEKEMELINAKTDKLKEIILDMGAQLKTLTTEKKNTSKI